MRYRIYAFTTILLTSASFLCSQQVTNQLATRKELLQKFFSNPRLDVTNEGDSIVKIRHKNSGYTTYKDIGDYPGLVNKTKTADLVIDLATIDTTLYSKMYSFWQEVPVARSFPMIVVDANHNGYKELYGVYRDYAMREAVDRAYEYTPQNTFIKVPEHPDSMYEQAIGDLENDGIFETAIRKDSSYRIDETNLRTISKIYVYTGATPHSFLTTYKTIFDIFAPGIQPNPIDFHDIDRDGTLEMIYTVDGDIGTFNPRQTRPLCIARFNKSTNTFHLSFNEYTPTYFTYYFAYGDVDGNGVEDIETGSIDGEAFIYKYQGSKGDKDSFSVQLMDSLPTKNLDMGYITKDMDGNGKNEIWVAGSVFSSGVPYTRIFVFEQSIDSSYKQIFRIDVVGVFSFFADNLFAADVDGDGKQEVLMCVDEWALIFRSSGPGLFSLYYIKRTDFLGQNSVFYSATLEDVDNDGHPELLICMDQDQNDQLRLFTRIYKTNSSLQVSRNEQLPLKWELLQNFPNPFNPSTLISFNLPQRSHVTLSVLDLLGHRIATLVNATQDPGHHVAAFDGTGFASGVYFYQLQTDGFTQTKKFVLLK